MISDSHTRYGVRGCCQGRSWRPWVSNQVRSFAAKPFDVSSGTVTAPVDARAEVEEIALALRGLLIGGDVAAEGAGDREACPNLAAKGSRRSLDVRIVDLHFHPIQLRAGDIQVWRGDGAVERRERGAGAGGLHPCQHLGQAETSVESGVVAEQAQGRDIAGIGLADVAEPE